MSYVYISRTETKRSLYTVQLIITEYIKNITNYSGINISGLSAVLFVVRGSLTSAPPANISLNCY